MAWTFVPLEPGATYEDALLVVAVPSATMIGPVAGRFLGEHLAMHIAGGFLGDLQPPVGVVRDGLITSPVQLWTTPLACGLDGRCDQLLVLRSDLTLPPEEYGDLAKAVMGWAAQHRVKLVVVLEGYAPEGDTNGVVAATSAKAREVPGRVGAKPMPQATITGLHAAMLTQANKEGVPAVGLFAPLEGEGHEAAAAVLLLKALDPLVPNIRLEPAALGKQAERIEGELRTARERQARDARRLADAVDRGYV
jgi:predicted ATP-grasp superfamily ATP-dependent carboligase